MFHGDSQAQFSFFKPDLQGSSHCPDKGPSDSQDSQVHRLKCLQVNLLDGPSSSVRTVDNLLVFVGHVLGVELAGSAERAHVVHGVLVVARLTAQSVEIIRKFSSSLCVLIEQKDASSFVVVHMVVSSVVGLTNQKAPALHGIMASVTAPLVNI